MMPMALFFFPNNQASESFKRKTHTLFSVAGIMLVSWLAMFALFMSMVKLIQISPF